MVRILSSHSRQEKAIAMTGRPASSSQAVYFASFLL